jgi:hypothetical protein
MRSTPIARARSITCASVPARHPRVTVCPRRVSSCVARAAHGARAIAIGEDRPQGRRDRVGPILVDQEPGRAVHDRLGQRAHPARHDGTRGGHRLERGAARIVRAGGHEREAVGGGQHRRQITIAVSREDHLTAEPHLRDGLLEARARLSLAHEQQPRLRHRRQHAAERVEQQLVAAVGGQPRDRHDDRRLAELELLADRRAIHLGDEARQVRGPRRPHHARGGHPDLAAPRLDLA